MALFDETLVEEVVGLVRRRYMELGTALSAPTEQESSDLTNEQRSFRADLRLLIGVANGEYRRSDALIRRVEQALTRTLDVLLGSAFPANISYPNDFWNTPVGTVVSRVRWWVSAEDLITISNAAAIAFGENTQANRMRISRAIDNGVLQWVPDPSVANPQHNRRVLRSDVERLRDQRRLPE